MRIEKEFYSEEARMLRRIEREEEERKEKLSKNQLEEEKLRLELGAQEIERKVKEMQKGNYQIIRQKQLDRFQVLTEIALAIAEAAPMDIVVDTDHLFGQIRMSADCLIIMASSPAEIRTGLTVLIKEAESVSLTTREDGLIELKFIFPFCSDVSDTEGYI